MQADFLFASLNPKK